MTNEWPRDNINSPVWIEEIPNGWGFHGRLDRTAYRVWVMGKPGEPHTNYPDASKEARRCYDAWI